MKSVESRVGFRNTIQRKAIAVLLALVVLFPSLGTSVYAADSLETDAPAQEQAVSDDDTSPAPNANDEPTIPKDAYIKSDNNAQDTAVVKNKSYVTYVNDKGEEDVVEVVEEEHIPYSVQEEIKIKIALMESTIIYKDEEFKKTKMKVLTLEDLEFYVVPNDGFVVEDVKAKSKDGVEVEVTLEGSVYKIANENVDKNLSIEVKTKEIDVDVEDETSPSAILPDDSEDSSVTLPADNILKAFGSVKTFGISYNTLEVSFTPFPPTASIDLPTGVNSSYSTHVLVTGANIDGYILAIPVGELTNISAGTGALYSDPPFPGLPSGDYYVMIVPKDREGGFLDTLPVSYSFDSGVTPAGHTQEISAYAYEAVAVPSGTGVYGSDLNIIPGGKSPSSTNNPHLTASTNEDFSIEKALVSSAGSDTLIERPYTEVAAPTALQDKFSIEYKIDLKSTSSGLTSGRVYQDSINVTDTITGYIDTVEGRPKSVAVYYGSESVSYSLIKETGGEYIINFDASPYTLDSNGQFKDDSFKVVVEFSKAAYTNLYGEDQILSVPNVILNEAKMSHTEKGTAVPKDVTPSSTANGVNIGYYQKAPQNPSLTIQKWITVSGLNNKYNDTYQGYYPSTSGSPMGFTLTPTSGPGTALSATVDSVGNIEFPELTPGTTYTLAEDPAIKDFTAFTPVDVVVSNHDVTGQTTVTIGESTTNYANGTFGVINTTDKLGSITVNVEKQQKNQYPAVYTDVANEDNVMATLYDASGEKIITTKVVNGIVQFHGVEVGQNYTVAVETELEDYQLPTAIPVNSSATEDNKFTIQYKYNYGSFVLGKQFVGPNGNPVNIPFDVEFGLFDAGGELVGEPFHITPPSPGEPKVKIIDQLFESGTYYLHEIAVTADGIENNSEYPLYTDNGIQVDISAGVFGSIPKAIDADAPIDATGLMSNNSVYGQLLLKNFTIGEDGKTLPLSGFGYEIKSGNTVVETIPTNSAGSKIVVNLPAGTYTVTQTTTKDGYVQLGTPQTVTIASATEYVDGLSTTMDSASKWILDRDVSSDKQTVGFINALKPTLQAKKVQANSNTSAVAAEFGLYKIVNGEYIYQKRTVSSSTSNSLISLDKLEEGTYAFIEKAAPTDYVAPKYVEGKIFNNGSIWISPVPVNDAVTGPIQTKTISYSDYSGTTTPNIVSYDNLIENVKKATLKIEMVDADNGSRIAGSEFTLYDNLGNPLGSAVKSAANGSVEFTQKLTAGTYTIKQTAMTGASADYVQRTTDITVVVDAKGNVTVAFAGDPVEAYQHTKSVETKSTSTTVITFSNAMKPSATLTKMAQTDVYDADGNRKTSTLAGAKFNLINSNDEVVLENIESDATGNISLEKLDPNGAPYTLVETWAPDVSGKEYTMASPLDITITLVKTTEKSENYKYTINEDSETVLNTLDLYNVNLAKYNIKVDTALNTITPEEKPGAMNAVFGIYKKDTDGEYTILVDTLTTGTGSQATPPEAIAISKPLPNGDYRIIELSSGFGSVGTKDANANLWYKNAAGDWTQAPGAGPDNLFFDFTIDGADYNLDLGNTAATGGPGSPTYVRIAGEKLGYIIDGDEYTLDGVLNDVVFDVYAAYKDASGNWVKTGEKLTTVTTGKVNVGGTIKNGYFLTRFIEVSEISSKLAAAGITAPPADMALAFDEKGPLPLGYKPGNQVVVQINTGSLSTGYNTLNANSTTPEIANYAGEGQLTIKKFDSLTKNIAPAGSKYDIYYATKNGETYTPDMLYTTTGPVEITNGTSGLTLTMPAGYYFLKEKEAPANYNLYGKFAVNGVLSGTDFVTDGLIGPVMIKGNGQATVDIYNKIMPKVTIVNTFDGVVKSGLNAKLDEISGVTVTQNDAAGKYETNRLPDVPFKISEKTLNAAAAEDYAINAKASSANGIDVFIAGGNVSLKHNGTNIPTTKNKDVYYTTDSNTGDVTVYINHEYKGSLSITKGYIDAIGGEKKENHEHLTTAEFTIESYQGDMAQVIVWAKADNAPKTIILPAGKYKVTETGVLDKVYFSTDPRPVYIEIEPTGRVYLKNFYEGNSLENPLTAAESASTNYFFNKINEGQLIVNKKDVDGNLLPGAQFALYKNDGGNKGDVVLFDSKPIIPTQTTGVDNGVFQANVLAGDYLVEEIQAPNNYDLRTELFPVTVEANKTAEGKALLNVVNPEKIGFTVKKTAEYPIITPDGGINGGEITAVGGIEFKLFKLNNTNSTWETVGDRVTETNKTDETKYGTINFTGLGVGEYALQEIVPEAMNYVGDNPDYAEPSSLSAANLTKIIIEDTNKDQVLEIRAEGKHIDNFDDDLRLLTVENTFVGEIFVAQKYDLGTGQPVAGATFGLYSDASCTNRLRPVVVSDSDGRAVFEPIVTEPGKEYYIKEISAPDGYYLSELYDKSIKTVTANNGTTIGNHVANFYNKMASEYTYGSVEITKSVLPPLEMKPLREKGFTANYTLEMKPVGNALPLANYSIVDPGVKFFSDYNGTIPIAKDLANSPKYTVSDVTIATSTAKLSNDAEPTYVWAQVNDSAWQLLDEPKSFPVSTPGITVRYSGTDPGVDGDPTEIGINFVPGKITFGITFSKHEQKKADALVKEVGSITNEASIIASTVSETGDVRDLEDSSTSKFEVPLDVRPQMAIVKTLSSANSVAPDGEIQYQIKLTNKGESAIVNPVVVDIMDSTQMSIAYNGSTPKYTIEDADGMTVNFNPAGGGSTPVWAFTGNLAPNATITINYTAKVLGVVKGDIIYNNAYGTSALLPLSYSSDYPNGASFVPATGQPSVNAADTTGVYASLNAAANIESGLYVYDTAEAVTVLRKNSYTSLKSLSTDGGKTWNSSGLIPSEVSAGGKITYKLMLKNDFASGGSVIKFNKIDVHDKLPSINDGRSSAWGVGSNDMTFDKDTVKVEIPGRKPEVQSSDYDVTYTEPDLNIKFKDAFELTAGEVLEITFDIDVPDSSKFDWDNQAYTNAINSFYADNSIKRLESNRPSVKLIPDPVSIEGTVWEDVVRDGIFDSGSEPTIEGAEVRLIPSTGGTVLHTTLADGTYSFTGLPASYNSGPKYTVEVKYPNTKAEVWQFVAPGTTWDGTTPDNSHIVNIDPQSDPRGELSGNTGSLALTKATNIANAGLLHAVYNVTYKDGIGSSIYTVTPGTMPTDDSNIEATSTYDVKGNGNATVNVEAAEPKRDGFKFDGWTVTSGASAGMDPEYPIGGTFTMPYNDVELTAKWRMVVPELVFTGYEGIYDGNIHGTTLTAASGSVLVAGDTIEYYVPDSSFGDPKDSSTWSVTGGWVETGSAITVGSGGTFPALEDFSKNVVESTPVKVIVSREEATLADLTADVIVLPRPVEIRTGTDSKPYDATPLTNGMTTVEPQTTDRGVVTGETIELATNGTVTHVAEGIIPNNYNLDWLTSTALEDNYIVEEIIGELSITPAPIVVNTFSATKVFDGAPLTAGGTVNGLATGETVNFAPTGTRTIVGTSVNTYDLAWTGNGANAIESDYYLAGEILGNLIITPLPPIDTFTGPDPGDVPDPIIPVPLTTVTPGTPPTTDIGDPDIPLGSNASWALLNLMLTIATGILMLMLLITYFTRKREEKGNDEESEYNERLREEEGDEGEIKLKRHGLVRIFSIVATIIAIVIFVLTEDMTLPMVFVDRFTIWHAIIAVLTVIIGVLSMKKYKLIEEDEEDSEADAEA